MNQQLVTLDFHGQAVAAYLVDGHRHALTDEQAGYLLGYASPKEAISKLTQRDEHGELDGLSTEVKLTSVEGSRTVTRSRRIWGREGVIALAMLSDTETGAKVRVWARKALMDKVDQVNASLTAPTKPAAQLREARTYFSEMLKFAKLLGLDGNRATIKAIQSTREQTGVDATQLFEIAGFIAETQERSLTATEIGKRLSPVQSAIKVNKLLETLGIQAKDAEGNWAGSPEHTNLWVLTEQARLHVAGSARALHWFPEVVPVLQAHLSA